jgi:hypothetical protein
MTAKTLYHATLLSGIPAACILIILLLAAGCTAHPGGSNGGPGGGSGSTGAGAGGGSSSGSAAGSGGPYPIVADADHIKTVFTVNCDSRRVYKSTESTDIQTVKVSGDLPLLIDRDWDKSPSIDHDQVFGAGQLENEGGAQLTVHDEWEVQCVSDNDCAPCHYVFDGPIWLFPILKHNQNDPADDWSAEIQIGAVTMNDMVDHKMTPYIRNLEPSCPTPGDIIVDNVQTCFANGEGTYGYLPMSYGDGSKITFPPIDSHTTLDSTAVFHISG